MLHTKFCPKSYAQKSYAKTCLNAPQNLPQNLAQKLPQNLSAKSHLYSFFTLTTLFMLNNAFGDEKPSIISPPPQ
ncbi:hypothetical protein [Helicobacter sp. T3_23-1056]